MNTEMMLDILSGIEDELIDEYFVIGEKARKTKKAKKFWVRIGAAVASLALILAVSVWMFVPLGTVNDSAIYRTVEIGDLNAQYLYKKVAAMSNFERWTLRKRLGEPYRSGFAIYYRVEGRGDIADLIVFDSVGNCNLIQFERFVGEDGTARGLDLTMGFVLETIYDISSADDIKSVTFSKDLLNRNDIEKKVKVPTVQIKDREQIERIFSAFSALKYPSGASNIKNISHSSPEYRNGELPLSVQTGRKVTLKLYDGRTLEWKLDPVGKYIDMGRSTRYGLFTDEDMSWLIDLAQIDMEYRYWGTHEDVFGGETASPRETEAPNE